MTNDLSLTAYAALPNRRENSNVKQVLADRLMVSEAIEAVGRMLAGFANKDRADKSYIGAMAQLLMHYPKQVALKCADPFDGVVRGTKFLPTPSDIIGWCEREIAPLHREADRERRVDEQLAMRDEFERQVVADGLKAKGRAWLERTDPVAKQLSGEQTKEQLADQARADLINRIGEEAFNAIPDASKGYFKKLSVET